MSIVAIALGQSRDKLVVDVTRRLEAGWVVEKDRVRQCIAVGITNYHGACLIPIVDEWDLNRADLERAISSRDGGAQVMLTLSPSKAAEDIVGSVAVDIARRATDEAPLRVVLRFPGGRYGCRGRPAK